MTDEKKGHPLTRAVAFFVVTVVVTALLALQGWLLMSDPHSPVPDEWSPLKPLRVSDPITRVTPFKLRWAIRDAAMCRSILAQAAQSTQMDPLRAADQCHIRNRVKLAGVGGATLDPLETACETALRLAMWEHHGLQPAARAHLGQSVRGIRHIGSYNCRRIRGSSNRMSTHATAASIDIRGVVLADGTRIDLLKDWDSPGARGAFLRDLRDTGCKWFSTVLGPDFNALHKDHFHLQNRGWGTCR
ncbi:extensin-like domain-containing protein [Arenibacterium sp. CAU 1754]